MTATGLTHTVAREPCTHVIKSREKGDLRLNDITGQILELVDDSDLVLMEGFLNRSMSAGITGMVHGAVRAGLIEAGLSYATLPPASLKKFGTGRGKATKIDMAVAAMKRSGLEFQDDNACDSWWLWVAANDHKGQPVLSLPKVQVECLNKIKMEG